MTASLVDQNPEKRAGHRSVPSQETGPDVDEDAVDQIAPTASAEPEAPIPDDLPDIIDVVIAMGGTPEEPPAEAPSPLPVVANPRVPAHLDALADRARDYVAAASSANTPARLCVRLEAVCQLVPAPGCRHVSARSAGGRPLHHGSSLGKGDRKPNSVSTIERRLSSLAWNYAQRGQPLDRKDRHIATVMAGIRNRHAAPPRQKEAVLPEDLIAKLETLGCGTLRGLRDRAVLLIGFTGGLRRSEIVALDIGPRPD